MRRCVGPMRVLTAATLCIISCSCERIHHASEQRIVLIQERQAAEAYAQALRPLVPLRDAWVEAVVLFRSASSAGTAKAIVISKLLPALMRYDQALRSVVIEHDAIRDIHTTLCEAHRRLINSYSTFSTDLSPTNYLARTTQLRSEYFRFSASQLAYRERLIALFTPWGVQLTNSNSEVSRMSTRGVLE